MRTRNWSVPFLAAVLAAGACSQTGAKHEEAGEEAKETEVPVADVAGEQKIALTDAIAVALAQHAGEVLEAGLEGEVEGGQRSVFVEVMILEIGRAHV